MSQPLPKLVISREEIGSIKIDIREWSREKRELFIDKVRVYLNVTSQKTVENNLTTFLGANFWYINSELYMSHGKMLDTFNSTSQGTQVVWDYPTDNPALPIIPINAVGIRGTKIDISKWSMDKKKEFLKQLLPITSNKPEDETFFLNARYWYLNDRGNLSYGNMPNIFHEHNSKQVTWELEEPETPIHAAIHNLQDEIEGVEEDEVEREEVVVFEGYDKEAVDRYIRKEFGKKHLKLFQHVMKHSD